MMIRPFVPRTASFDTAGTDSAVSASVMLLITVAAAVLLGMAAAKKYEGNKAAATLSFAGIALVAGVACICLFGCAAAAVKGILFSLILVFSSYEDIKTRECGNCLSVMVVVAAFVGTEPASVPMMLLSSLLLGGTVLLTCLIAKGGVGGADIKMTAACAFLLGLPRGIIGLLLGMLLAVAVNAIRNRKDKKKGFPMIPYLAAGFMTAYFIPI